MRNRARFISRKFQSTLPHGERLANIDKGGANVMVSIHAPARGATKIGIGLGVHSEVSIHAPARGATFLLPTATAIPK